MNSSSYDSSPSLNSSKGDLWNPCPSSPLGVQIFFAVEAINLVFGLLVNAWTVWSIGYSAHSVQATEGFTLNLAALECVYILLSFLRPLNYYSIRSASLFTFNLFFYGLLSSGRPLFQACVCLERFLGVVHPVFYLRYNTVKSRLRALPLVWAFTLFFCICNVQKFVFPVLFLLLLVLQVFCCARMLQVLRQPAPGDGSKERVDPNKKKAFITVLVLQVMMVLNYLPAVLAVPLRGRLSRHIYTCKLVPASLSFSVFGSFIQPIT